MTRSIAAVALLLLALLATVARADGKLFQRAIVAEPPHTPDQRALVVFDEERGVETLVVETTAAFESAAGAQELAWVIPLPARPEIEASTTGLFPTLETLCAPTVDSEGDPSWILLLGLGLGVCAAVRWSGRGLRRGVALTLPLVSFLAFGCLGMAMFVPSCSMTLGSAASPSGARVLDRRTVGVFDTTTLTATDAPALRAWLTENGFAAPESIDPVVTDLLREGWVFVASKAHVAGTDDVARLHPLAFTFETTEPVYPMRLTGVDGAPLELTLFVAGPRRARAGGLEVAHCEDGAIGTSYSFHDELARRLGDAPVLTKLSGTLDVAAMRDDVRVEWTTFEPHATVWFGARAAAHHAGDAGVLAGLVVLLLAAMASRRREDCASGRPRRFDAVAFGAAFVTAGVAWGIAFAAAPRVPEGAVVARLLPHGLHHLLSEPPDDVAGDVAAVRAWASAATEGVANAYTAAPIREEDSPGNWWLRQRDSRIEIVTWAPWGAGRVVDVSGLDAFRGTVRDHDGRPVPDAEVRFVEFDPDRRPEPGQFLGYDVSVTTESDGSFTARLRAGRTWDVAVVPEGRPYALYEGVIADAGSAAFDIVLPRAAVLRGRVLDDAARPVAGVTVGAAVESPFTVREERFATTDAEGWFEIPGLDAETDDLWVNVHVHEEPECRARFSRRFRGRLPPAEPFVITFER